MESKPLRSTIKSFLLDAKARNLRPSTVLGYARQVNAFADFAEKTGAYTLADVTPTLLRTYLVAERERGLADESVHTAARSLRAWMYFCEAEGLIDVSPMRRVRMPKRDKPRPDSFTPDEVQAMLDACIYARDTAIVLALLDTGCRAAEFLALNVGDVNERTGAVRVSALAKDREERTVYMGRRALAAWHSYMAERGAVAPDAPAWITLDRNTRLTYEGLKQMLRRLYTAAGVPRAGVHQFRRTFATWALRGGMNAYVLSRLMGHSSLGMLGYYLDIQETDLQAAHEKAAPVDRLLK